jgi:hypothetical protein
MRYTCKNIYNMCVYSQSVFCDPLFEAKSIVTGKIASGVAPFEYPELRDTRSSSSSSSSSYSSSSSSSSSSSGGGMCMCVCMCVNCVYVCVCVISKLALPSLSSSSFYLQSVVRGASAHTASGTKPPCEASRRGVAPPVTPW